MEKSSRRAVPALVLTALLVLSLVPILMVGDCAHPFGDDYAFSVFAHQAQQEGGSVLGAVAYTVRRYYFGWQGTFAGIALMALQPGLLGEQAYILTPILLLGGLCLSTACLTHALLRRWLGQDRWTWLGVTAALLLFTIQHQPNVLQGFFWWNSGVFYTGFYVLMLLLFTCLVRLRLRPRRPRLLFAAALVLAALVGGGNYVTGLLSCLVVGGYAAACALWDRRRLWCPAAVGAVLLASFLLNVLAPGNRVRQGSAAGMAPLRAVWASVCQAGEDLHAWVRIPLLALLLGMVPVLWRALENVEFSFPLPGAATAALFLVLACQNAPHFYALAEAGPGRIRNVVFNTYPWLLLAAEGYWLGWLRRKRGGGFLTPGAARWMAQTAAFVAVAGVLLCYPYIASYQCAQNLADGSAQTYDAHVTGWVQALADPAQDPVTVEALPVRPLMLYYFNLTQDPEDFANTCAANYYGKSSVTVLPEAEGTP